MELSQIEGEGEESTGGGGGGNNNNNGGGGIGEALDLLEEAHELASSNEQSNILILPKIEEATQEVVGQVVKQQVTHKMSSFVYNIIQHASPVANPHRTGKKYNPFPMSPDLPPLSALESTADHFIQRAFQEGFRDALYNTWENTVKNVNSPEVDGKDFLRESMRYTQMHGLAALAEFSGISKMGELTTGKGSGLPPMSSVGKDKMTTPEYKAITRDMKNAFMWTVFEGLNSGAIQDLSGLSDKEKQDMLLSLYKDMGNKTATSAAAMIDYASSFTSPKNYPSSLSLVQSRAISGYMKQVVNNAEDNLGKIDQVVFNTFYNLKPATQGVPSAKEKLKKVKIGKKE